MMTTKEREEDEVNPEDLPEPGSSVGMGDVNAPHRVGGTVNPKEDEDEGE
jgi:hypothetical protein